MGDGGGPWACVGKTYEDMARIAAAMIRKLTACPAGQIEDAIQEFMIGALEAIDRRDFDAANDGALEFVLTGGLNRVRNFLRAERRYRDRHREMPMTADDDGMPVSFAETVPARGLPVGMLAAATEAHGVFAAAVGYAIGQLPEDESRRMMDAFCDGDESQGELAQRFGVSRARVRREIAEVFTSLRSIIRAARRSGDAV